MEYVPEVLNASDKKKAIELVRLINLVDEKSSAEVLEGQLVDVLLAIRIFTSMAFALKFLTASEEQKNEWRKESLAEIKSGNISELVHGLKIAGKNAQTCIDISPD